MISKVKYELEFPILSSPQLLYQYLSTASGLSEWFAENVIFREDIFTFQWNDSEEKAKLTTQKTGERIKLRWLNENDEETDYFVEFKILVDELTKDVSLVVIDFAEPNDVESAKQLWHNQINELKHVIGSS